MVSVIAAKSNLYDRALLLRVALPVAKGSEEFGRRCMTISDDY